MSSSLQLRRSKHIAHCSVQGKLLITAPIPKVICIQTEEHRPAETVLLDPVCFVASALFALKAYPVVAVEGVGRLGVLVQRLQ